MDPYSFVQSGSSHHGNITGTPTPEVWDEMRKIEADFDVSIHLSTRDKDQLLAEIEDLEGSS